ncbi:MAG: response regulator [Elusimicrobia bacterium]|nr:response regulator [Elusimicrobiota bacterium]
MQRDDEGLRRKLLLTYRGEAEDHVRELRSGLMGLEKPAAGALPGILETVFRAAHSLKGAARAVNERETENLCQALESALAGLKRAGTAPEPPLLDTLLAALRALEGLTACAGDKPAELLRTAAEMTAGLENATAARGAAVPAARPAAQTATGVTESEPASENVRVPLATLESLLRQTEEMLASKLSAGQRCGELKTLLAEVSRLVRDWPVARSPGEEGPFEGLRGRLRALEKGGRALLQAMEQDQRALAARIDLLHEEMKQTMMLPFSTLVEGFPLFFREVLRSQGKEADLVMEGAELSADRRILQEMKAPLLHLLRNSVDHGIEKPEERLKEGKPARGRVSIAITKREGNKAGITIRDDGGGIDAVRVTAAAARLGLLDSETLERGGKAAAEALIFRSGVSTSPIITSISGRGLGLAIVRDKVERLGGSVAVKSAPGGTAFSITLPLTVSTMRGVLVETGGEVFAVPLAQVERVGRAGPGDLRTVEGRPAVSSGGRELPLGELGTALGLPPPRSGGRGKYAQFVVAASGGARQAFLVDEVLTEQELLVKGLDEPLSQSRGASGAAVLGSGRVVAMLNMRGLMEGGAAAAPAPAAGKPGPERKRRVLVVEDSVTSRTLLRNIFEAAGYEVRTAVDGAAGFELLRSYRCDLVVSDVDMPRMNGFELTGRIRKDRDLSALPVVLVTALESDRDRERGIDAGANAYLVKSRFDQSDILEIAGRLIR